MITNMRHHWLHNTTPKPRMTSAVRQTSAWIFAFAVFMEGFEVFDPTGQTTHHVYQVYKFRGWKGQPLHTLIMICYSQVRQPETQNGAACLVKTPCLPQPTVAWIWDNLRSGPSLPRRQIERGFGREFLQFCIDHCLENRSRADDGLDVSCPKSTM